MGKAKCHLCGKFIRLDKDWHIQFVNVNPPKLRGGSPPPKAGVFSYFHEECFDKMASLIASEMGGGR